MTTTAVTVAVIVTIVIINIITIVTVSKSYLAGAIAVWMGSDRWTRVRMRMA